MLLLKAIAMWVLIMVFAVLNGALRQATLLPNMPAPAAFVLSGILLSLCIVVIAFMFVRRLGPVGTAGSVYVGLLWLLLTVAFEFGFGRLVLHKSWPTLLEPYTFKDANLWPLVLVVVLFAPLFAVRFGGRFVTPK
jgi:hypothetical protein